VRAFVEAMRGFYLAEPDALSALVIVDQLMGGEAPGRAAQYRVRGGNDRLVEALAREIGGRIERSTVLRAVAQDGAGVRVVVERNRRRQEIGADYAILTMPPPLLRACRFEPPLPPRQRAALDAVTLGAATKVSARFARAFWRQPGRPRAFGSNLPIGAFWEAAEEQHAAVLTFLGGAGCSATLAAAARDPAAMTAALRPFGTPTFPTLVGDPVAWEDDPLATGGYAVFGPAFDPRDRRLLGASHGRVLFAGEHTSACWQGFMNGAVESGQQAARDLEVLHRLAGRLPGGD
jgi:monoamine oxidase